MQDSPSKEAKTEQQKLDITGDRAIFPVSQVGPPQKEYEVYCLRWLVLSAYTLSLFLSSGSYGTFIPFSDYFQRIYGISHLSIVMTAMIIQILYLPCSFLFANPFIKATNTKYAVSTMLNFVDACRESWYDTLYVGQSTH